MQNIWNALVAGLGVLVIILAVSFWIGAAFGVAVQGFRLGAGW